MAPTTHAGYVAHWVSSEGAVRVVLAVGATEAEARALARPALVRVGLAHAGELGLRLTPLRIAGSPGPGPPRAA